MQRPTWINIRKALNPTCKKSIEKCVPRRMYMPEKVCARAGVGTGCTCARVCVCVCEREREREHTHTAAMDGDEPSPGGGWVTSAPKTIVGMSVRSGIFLFKAASSTVFLPPT